MSGRGIKIAECYRNAHRAALAAGWHVSLTRGGHLRWQPPSGPAIFTSQSPGSRSGVAKDLCHLRRAGLRIGR